MWSVSYPESSTNPAPGSHPGYPWEHGGVCFLYPCRNSVIDFITRMWCAPPAKHKGLNREPFSKLFQKRSVDSVKSIALISSRKPLPQPLPPHQFESSIAFSTEYALWSSGRGKLNCKSDPPLLHTAKPPTSPHLSHHASIFWPHPSHLHA